VDTYLIAAVKTGLKAKEIPLMSKDKVGNWKPFVQEEPHPVPAQGLARVGYGDVPADIVLPICPHTLQIVEEEPDDE
jgi:hypothetical protein